MKISESIVFSNVVCEFQADDCFYSRTLGFI